MSMNAARGARYTEARSRRCGTLSAGKARRRTPLGRVAFDDEVALSHAPAAARSYRRLDPGLLWSFAVQRVGRMAHMTYIDEYNVSTDRNRQHST
jgi:hypothetical protein